MKKALELMMMIGGMAYKKDLVLGMSGAFKNDGLRLAERKILRIKNKGWFEEVSKEEYNTAYSLIKLTPEGYKQLATYQDISLKQLMDQAPRQINYQSSYALRESMEDKRVLLAMHSVGIPFYPSEKPTLEGLCDKNVLEEYGPELLKNGIFYTDKEIRAFLKDSEFHDEDTTLACKFAGAIISQDKIIIVFLETPGKNKAITFYSKPMNGILKALNQKFKSITLAFRTVKNFGDRLSSNGIFTERKSYRLRPYALMISNGYEKVYSSVVGNKFGKLELGETQDGIDNRENVRIRLKEREKKDKASYYLRADLNEEKALFDRIFVIPFNSDGTVMLNYLVHTSIEQWYEDSKQIFQNSEYFSVPELDRVADLRFPGLDNSTKRTAIYFPVPELNMLRKLYETKKECSIVTTANLITPFARSIRNNNITFYTLDNGKVEKLDTPGVFTTSGRYTGREKLETYLKEENWEYTENEYKKLPGLFGLSAPEFWQQVDEGKITYEQVMATLSPHVYKKKVRFKKKKQHGILFYVPEETYKALKKYCLKKGYSVRYYVTSLVAPRFHEIEAEENPKKDTRETIEI